jgi:anti-sigma factor RsiW
MTDLSAKLSAYLDGELTEAEAVEIDTALVRDPQIQAELDALVQADALARDEFEHALNAPVPLNLIRQIKNTPLEAKAPDVVVPMPQRRPIWGSIAAGFLALAVGGFGGYTYKDQTTPAPQRPGWIATIAEYHGIYADQKRHLVEVRADETEHIENWLGNTVGATFSVPDLAQHGLTFEGGRLVVANGKPVAQLMYTQSDGTVVALCLQKSSKAPVSDITFKEQTIDRFDFVSWSANGADYVVIGPTGLQSLPDIAGTAALNV